MYSSEAVHWICTEVSPRDVCSTLPGMAAGREVGAAETVEAITEGNMVEETAEGFISTLVEGLTIVLGMTSGMPKYTINKLLATKTMW